ncbi:hypothetical protein WK13_23690 [Burkholderia ubonensis]|nr:hypothetical protein WK13_23690 [Burkholderia ubonensis]
MTERVRSGQLSQIVLETEHLHDGKIRAHCDARTASLQRAKRHRRHARAFRDLLGCQLSAQARELQPLAKFDEQLAGFRQERAVFFAMRLIFRCFWAR